MFIVTVYRLEDNSIFERRVVAHREELDKYLNSIVLENCEVSIVPETILSTKFSKEVN